MDLLERGWSLSQLGKSLRWTDIRAFLLYAPANSNYRVALDAEDAKREHYRDVLTQPIAKLVGGVQDELFALRMGSPDHLGTVFRLLSSVYEVDPEALAREINEKATESNGDTTETGSVKKKTRTAKEIRAQLAAVENHE